MKFFGNGAGGVLTGSSLDLSPSIIVTVLSFKWPWKKRQTVIGSLLKAVMHCTRKDKRKGSRRLVAISILSAGESNIFCEIRKVLWQVERPRSNGGCRDVRESKWTTGKFSQMSTGSATRPTPEHDRRTTLKKGESGHLKVQCRRLHEN